MFYADYFICSWQVVFQLPAARLRGSRVSSRGHRFFGLLFYFHVHEHSKRPPKSGAPYNGAHSVAFGAPIDLSIRYTQTMGVGARLYGAARRRAPRHSARDSATRVPMIYSPGSARFSARQTERRRGRGGAACIAKSSAVPFLFIVGRRRRRSRFLECPF